ncbi:MAG: hypothetical protein IJP29_03665, partial [Lachnospiraceae bacterium]|nr:hypothetical protein [Lachnospiraceae bacterium]
AKLALCRGIRRMQKQPIKYEPCLTSQAKLALCRGIRRMQKNLNMTACKQASGSHIQVFLRMAHFNAQKSFDKMWFLGYHRRVCLH